MSAPNISNRQDFMQHYTTLIQSGSEGAEEAKAMLLEATQENEQVGAVVQNILNLPVGSPAGGSSSQSVDLTVLWGNNPPLADEDETKDIMQVVNTMANSVQGTAGEETSTEGAGTVAQLVRDSLEQTIGDSIKDPALKEAVLDHLTKEIEGLLTGEKKNSTAETIATKLAELAYRLGRIAAGEGDPGGEIPDDSIAGLVRKSAGDLKNSINESLGMMNKDQLKKVVSMINPELGEVITTDEEPTADAINTAIGNYDDLSDEARQELTGKLIDSLTDAAVRDRGLDPETDAAAIAALKEEIAEKVNAHLERHPTDLGYMTSALRTDSSDAAAVRFMRRLGVDSPSSGIMTVPLSNIDSRQVKNAMTATVALLVQLIMLNLQMYSRNRELAASSIDAKFDLSMSKAENTRLTADKQLELDMNEIKQRVFEMVVESIGAIVDIAGSAVIALNPIAGLIVKGVGSLTTGLTKGIAGINYDTAQAYMKQMIEHSRAAGEEIEANKDKADSNFQLVLKDMDKAMEMVRSLMDMMTQMVQMLNQIEQKAGAMGA